MSGPGPTFDGGGMQAVDVQFIADFFQQAQFWFGQGAVSRRHVAGQRIGGFIQPFGKVITQQAEQGVKPVFLSNSSNTSCDMWVRRLVSNSANTGSMLTADWILTSSAVRMFSSEAEMAIIRATRQSWGLSMFGSVCGTGCSFLRSFVAVQNIDDGRSAQ